MNNFQEIENFSKKKFRLNKKNIFIIYRYYLLEKNFFSEEEKNFFEEKKKIENMIIIRLKNNWLFSDLPPLEKSILFYSLYEMFLKKNFFYHKMIIDQVVNFSKSYLDNSKYKYINKILDLVRKEEIIKENLKIVLFNKK